MKFIGKCRLFIASATIITSLILACSSFSFAQNAHVEPLSIDFGAAIKEKKIFIVKDGEQPISWTANTEEDWISLSLTSGTVEGDYSYIKVKVIRDNLTPGDYTGTVHVQANGASQDVVVSMICSGMPQVKLKYFITIDHPDTHYAHVKLVIENVATVDQFTLDSHTWERDYIWFENITVHDQDENTVPFDVREISEALIWTFIDIENPNHSNTITVEYDIHYICSGDGDLNTLQSAILQDYAVFDMAMWLFTFMYGPFDFFDRAPDTEITFATPETWLLVSPWEEESGNHYAGTLDTVFARMIGFGDFEIETFSVNGLTVRVGIPQGAYSYLTVTKETLIQTLRNALAEVQNIYGNPSRNYEGWDDIVSIIVAYPPIDIHDGGYGTVVFASGQPFEVEIPIITSGLLTQWARDDPGIWISAVIYTQGLYDKIRMAERMGFCDRAKLIREIESWFYDEYLSLVYQTKYDGSVLEIVDLLMYNNQYKLSPEDREGYERTRDSKFALINYLLDKTMQVESHGQKSIDDFLRYMNQHFAGDYTAQDVIDAFSAITGWDFSQFFQDYYFGTELLPAEPYILFDKATLAVENHNYNDALTCFTSAREKALDFGLETLAGMCDERLVQFVDSDGDGLFDIWERHIGTDPNNPDTDGDELSDSEEIGANLIVDGTGDDLLRNLIISDPQGDSETTEHGSDIKALYATVSIDKDGERDLYLALTTWYHTYNPDIWYEIYFWPVGEIFRFESKSLTYLLPEEGGQIPIEASFEDHLEAKIPAELIENEPLMVQAITRYDITGQIPNADVTAKVPLALQPTLFITDPTSADTDSDQMPDGWEIQYGLNPLNASDADDDPDADGLTNLEEDLAGTDPTVSECLPCGDVNLDEDLTPADALCIFQKYLAIPSCLDGRPECPWD